MAIREHRDDLVAVAHFVEYAIAADAARYELALPASFLA